MQFENRFLEPESSGLSYWVLRGIDVVREVETSILLLLDLIRGLPSFGEFYFVRVSRFRM